MQRINAALGIMIESIYDSLTLYFVFIVCMMNFFVGRIMQEFLLITIGFIILMRLVLPSIREKRSSRVIFLVLVLLTSLALSAMLFIKDEIIFLLLGFGYFTLCGFDVLIKDRKESYLPEEMKKLLIILFFSGFMTLYLRSKEYLEVINNTASFYCLFSIIYLIRMNLIHEYKGSSMEVNSHSNIVFVNLLSLIVALIFIGLQRNVLTWFPYLFLLITMGAVELFNHIWGVINWVLQTILAISLKIHPSGYTKTGSENLDSSMEELIFQEEAPSRELEDIQGAVEHYEGIKILVIIIILILLAALIYFCYKKMNSTLNENLGDPEEKSFVFSKEEWKDSMRRKINHILGRDITDPVRKKYVKTVNFLIKKGYEMEKGMTPNEYLDSVYRKDSKLCNEQDLGPLTEKYNVVRYLKEK